MTDVLTIPQGDDIVIVWECDHGGFSVHAGLLTVTTDALESALATARRLAGTTSDILVRGADRSILRLRPSDVHQFCRRH